jgi:ABC-type oligopeptide transport system substrate-binding subunit
VERGVRRLTQLRETLSSGDAAWARQFQDPSNCVVSGAFRPADVLADRAIVLERNPEFYAADRVDVDRVVFAARPAEKANWAALRANRLDYYRGVVPRETVDAFPEDVEQRQVPGQDGLCLAFDHGTTVFETPAARQAIASAIDAPRIARDAHETRYDPVTIPGGHAYRLRELLGDEFVETTLTSDDLDRESAARKMRAAAFSREGDSWVDGDGEPLELSITSPESTPTVAITVAEQLAAFGIDASWESVPVQVFRENLDRGRLDCWPTARGVGYALPAVGRLYASTVRHRTRAEQWFRIFPADQVREASYDGRTLSPRTPEDLDAFTLEAPPLGEPDGPLRTWHAPRLSWECSRASTVDEYAEKLRQLAWLYNWHLPVIPIANGSIQHFVAVDRLEWPVGDPEPFPGVGVSEFQPEDAAALGAVTPKSTNDGG